MKRITPPHTTDALVAALEAARESLHSPVTVVTVQRVLEHAVALGVLNSRTEPGIVQLMLDTPPSTKEELDLIITHLVDLRREQTGKTVVLVVEDDKLTASVLVDMLAADERTIIVARSAADAIAFIREQDVNIILLDLILPDGDGRDLLAQLRITPATRAVPVLVITGRTDEVTQAECFALGADALLAKPVAQQVLLAVVASQLAHAEERRLEGRVDGLTMLANRGAFMDALGRIALLSRRNNQPLALAMIDLDDFKSVNDNYGHAVGDEVLQQCAQTIARALRTSDFVARWGGEELCSYFPDTTLSGAVQAMEKALKMVRQLRFTANDETFAVTFSAGVALLENTGPIVDSLKEADRLMYVAKARGRNRIVSRADEGEQPRQCIMLVEDDESVARFVRILLEQEGFEVLHVADAEKALEVTGHRTFALAIVDVGLPRTSGYDLVAKLRKSFTAAKMPILFLTGLDDEEDAVRGFSVGANDYVTKPFYPRELIARINRILPKR